jgi:hypothetical protein
MKLPVAILLCLLVFAPGCLGRDDDESSGGKTTSTRTDAQRKPPLPAD